MSRIFVLYFCLPETENRTLEDIELHFTDNSKKMYDINIVKVSQKINRNAIEMDSEFGSDDKMKRNETRNGCDNKAFDKF